MRNVWNGVAALALVTSSVALVFALESHASSKGSHGAPGAPGASATLPSGYYIVQGASGCPSGSQQIELYVTGSAGTSPVSGQVTDSIGAPVLACSFT